MEILLLYNNINAKKLAGKLQEAGHRIIPWKQRFQVEDLERINPDRVISYTYRFIIPREVIEISLFPILNLHISYLPWNRGADPNFWSFMEDTPKGVTIHEISEKIDGGRILLQKELFFEEGKETFASSYEKLNEEIINLFMRHSQELLDSPIEKEMKRISEAESRIGTEGKGGQSKEGVQQTGSYHNKKQFVQFREKYPFSWEENIAEYKARIKYPYNGRPM